MNATKFLPAVALLSVVAGLVPRTAAAVDPFYTRLLDQGVRDLELGRTKQAQDKLRTACFGFLDEPTLLAEGLIQLGRAQASDGNTAELLETVERLAEIEDRFNAYSGIDGALKAVFENALQATLSKSDLERVPMFSHLAAAPEPRMPDTQPRPQRRRRKALERQLTQNPDDAEALLALAEVHHRSGRLAPASELLDRLLVAQPGNERALCLRAEIAADREECEPVLAALSGCATLTASNLGAAFVIDCLVSAGRSPEAAALLEALPIERRQAPRVARAARRIETTDDSLATSPDESSTQEPGAAERVPPELEDDAPRKSRTDLPEIKIGLSLEERMRRLREEIAASRFREHLDRTMENAIQLANDYPDSPQAQYLAAEVAYLSSDWRSVLEYFDRGGRPSGDRPELLFYLAVATYEIGDPEEADSILREALPNLPKSPFVDGYIARILIPPSL
ncbi:MAG: tetratricopeptide repeat protein [bacterium]|nr:tetratricopeptide repeat protein [bacterium]